MFLCWLLLPFDCLLSCWSFVPLSVLLYPLSILLDPLSVLLDPHTTSVSSSLFQQRLIVFNRIHPPRYSFRQFFIFLYLIPLTFGFLSQQALLLPQRSLIMSVSSWVTVISSALACFFNFPAFGFLYLSERSNIHRTRLGGRGVVYIENTYYKLKTIMTLLLSIII